MKQIVADMELELARAKMAEMELELAHVKMAIIYESDSDDKKPAASPRQPSLNVRQPRYQQIPIQNRDDDDNSNSDS
jgi:hypothetical protein